MKKTLFAAMLSAAAFYGCQSGENISREQQAFDTISKEIKARFAPDGRVSTLAVELEQTGGKYMLKGVTNQPQAKEAYLQAFREQGISIIDSIGLLPDASVGDRIYGVAAQSVINFRTFGKYSAESATQVMMGTPLEILQKKPGWTRAKTLACTI